MSRRCLRERARVKRERKPRLLSKRQAPATSHPAPSRATNPCSPAASKPVACCQRRPWRFLWFHPHALVCCATAVSSRKPRAGPDDMAMPPVSRVVLEELQAEPVARDLGRSSKQGEVRHVSESAASQAGARLPVGNPQLQSTGAQLCRCLSQPCCILTPLLHFVLPAAHRYERHWQHQRREAAVVPVALQRRDGRAAAGRQQPCDLCASMICGSAVGGVFVGRGRGFAAAHTLVIQPTCVQQRGAGAAACWAPLLTTSAKAAQAMSPPPSSSSASLGGGGSMQQ